MNDDAIETSTLRDRGGPTVARPSQTRLPWPILLLLVGLAVLYLPTYYSLSQTFWETEEQGHGPLILAVSAYLIWTKRKNVLGGVCTPSARSLAWPLLTFGLVLYVLGRSQDIILFEAGSQILVLGSVALLIGGWRGLSALLFPLLFLVFMLPLPGVVVDAITGPLKHNVSAIAEAVLYAAGYPIARHGVVLTIGQYQLLVADACSGLHSMFSLGALGLLYLYLMKHQSLLRNSIIVVSILPIAFLANVIRVMVLVLVTYHYGDEAGQGFIHGFAGMALFVIALVMLFLLDGALGIAFRSDKNLSAIRAP